MSTPWDATTSCAQQLHTGSRGSSTQDRTSPYRAHPTRHWITTSVPMSPPNPSTNLYALSKGLGQEICRIFTTQSDIYVLCYLFYIFCYHDDLSRPGLNRPFLVTWRDASAAFLPGLTIDLKTLPSQCEVFNIFANRPHQKFSNEKAKRILGWQPKDDLTHTYLKSNV